MGKGSVARAVRYSCLAGNGYLALNGNWVRGATVGILTPAAVLGSLHSASKVPKDTLLTKSIKIVIGGILPIRCATLSA